MHGKTNLNKKAIVKEKPRDPTKKTREKKLVKLMNVLRRSF